MLFPHSHPGSHAHRLSVVSFNLQEGGCCDTSCNRIVYKRKVASTSWKGEEEGDEEKEVVRGVRLAEETRSRKRFSGGKLDAGQWKDRWHHSVDIIEN